MGEYEETIKDIRETLGILPAFMKDLPREELVEDWHIWKHEEPEMSLHK
ncbi:hypothetical protein [Methanolobus halotolerans]|nr:hypothetical protein [Methanolobus halotolerans]